MREIWDARWPQAVRLAAGLMLCALLMALPKVGYESLYLPGFALPAATYWISEAAVSLFYPMAAYDARTISFRRGSLLRPAMQRVRRDAVDDADVWDFRRVAVRSGGAESGGTAYNTYVPHLAVRLKNGVYVVADRAAADVYFARRFAEELRPSRAERRRPSDCAIEKRTLWPVVALRLSLLLVMAALMWLRWRAL